MGTTLQGTQIRNTYNSVLKTTNNTSLGGSLKVISDGDGNDSALSLSSTEVKVESLSIENVSSNESLTKMLMWNDSTKNIERRNYNPSGVNAISADSVTSPNGAQIQLDAGATCKFLAGDNIQITGSGSGATAAVTISTSIDDAAENVDFAMTSNTESDGAGSFYTEIVHTFTDFEGNDKVSTIRGSNGIDITSSPNTVGGRDFTIDAGRAYWRVDRPSDGGTYINSFSGGTSSDSALMASMDLTDVTAYDLLVVVDMSRIDSQLDSIQDRTITLPPPYPGRKIKVICSPVPSSSTFSTMDLPIRFTAANVSEKDNTTRQTKFFGRTVLIESNGTGTGDPNYKVQSPGTSGAKDFIYFQDVTDDQGSALNSSTRLGLGIGTNFELFGVDDTYYMVDARVYAYYDVEVVGNDILQDGT